MGSLIITLVLIFVETLVVMFLKAGPLQCKISLEC
jgi:hypothetical protein